MESSRDSLVRAAAFAFLDRQQEIHGDVLMRDDLQRGFQFEGQRVPLLGPQGIFKPAVLEHVPLSITTVPEVEGKPRPYDDNVGTDGLLWYAYRGRDSQHPENRGLRTAMQEHIPLVYFFGIVPSKYLPIFPVFIVGDDPSALRFKVDVDARQLPHMAAEPSESVEEPLERRYAVAAVRRRMHQQAFRGRVLEAYRDQCAVCRLKHSELLEAAHIIPDRDPGGVAAVSNGLALCALHHVAFDRYIIGVRPDLVIEIRKDILAEVDGPMLTHGLQGFEGLRIQVPKAQRLRPAEELLDERYRRFKKAS